MPETVTPTYHGSYLTPALEHATVADAMHPGILTCPVSAPVTEVARLLATHHVHCLAVMHDSQDGSGEPYIWGIISDLDLVRAGLSGEASSAGAIAAQPMITVRSTMALRDAGELMLRERVSHLVVIHPESRRPVGVLSTLDLAGILAWGEARDPARGDSG